MNKRLSNNFYAGKGKHWDNPPWIVGNTVRIKEDDWFKHYQKMLLWFVNTNEGRSFFGIEKDFPHIIEISKRHIKGILGIQNNRFYFKSEFRVGAKYGNIIRYNWLEFLKVLRYYQ